MVNELKASHLRSERNKERLIRAALELFRVHGIRKTSMNEIAQEAKLSSATVYNHFGSKEDLVYATVKHFVTRAGAEFRKIVEGNLPFPEKLKQVLLFKQDIFGQYQGELLQAIVANSKIGQYIDSVYLIEFRQIINDFYEQGKRQGYIDKGLSTEILIRYSEIMRKGMAAESVLSEDSESNLKLLQQLTPLFLYGIMGKPG